MKLSIAVVLICLLLCNVARSDCQESRLFDIQTGLITLSPNDLGAAGASKDYYQPLTNASFGVGDRLGFSFALVGFQASCTQDYFSLMVSVVKFQNSNTKMSIVVDFRNPNLDKLTTWTNVQFSYLVVSAARYETAPVNTALIWATNIEVDLTNPVVDTAILKDNFFNHPDDPTRCGLTLVAGAYQMDTAGCPGAGFDVAVHAYIMGFQFKPISTSTDPNFLAASIVWPGLNSAPNTNYLTIGSEAPSGQQAITITYGAAGAVAGPRVSIKNYGGQLQTIKVGFVFTVINQRVTAAGANVAGWNMAVASLFQYSYSGIYQLVDPATIGIQSLLSTTGTDNNALLTKLPTTKYMIFGLSSFELARTSACTSVSLALSINTPNSYTFTANNAKFLTNVVFQADIYTANNGDLCNAQISFASLTADDTGLASAQLSNARGTVAPYDNLVYKTTRISQVMQTNPTNTVNQFIYQDTDNPLNLKFFVNGLSGDSTYVKFRSQVVMQNINNGKPYGIRLQMIPVSTTTFAADADGNKYVFQLTVGGKVLFSKTYSNTELDTIVANPDVVQQFYGLNLAGTNVTVVYDVWIPRNPSAAIVNYDFQMIVDLYEFQYVYDPVTECCVDRCPANTGLNVLNAPATCVLCDTAKGLFYNPSTATCDCITGYYLDAKLQFQCFPCQGPLCATCDAITTTKCLTCLNGAALNSLNSSCACTSGFFTNGSICSACPVKCLTCAASTSCTTCSDPTRDPSNNCSCIRGFFDAGVAQCAPCSASCFSCNNSQTCTQCDPRLSRVISGNVCVCADGFYELAFQNGTRNCQACSGECLTCGLSSSDCTSCDATVNRLQGYDNLGHRTCVCRDGFFALPDFSCVQSNCTADPFCSQCEKDLLLCVQCQASKFRVIDLRSHVCVCQPGYYQDSTNNCQPCGSGCATCSSATNCTSCVATATPTNGTGRCACPIRTFYTTLDGVGFCSSCPNFCNTCSSSVTCTTCANGFNLTTDGICICPSRFFINTAGQCIPCRTGCAVCTSNTTCSQCVAPLVVQNNACVGTCSSGFYLSGTVCQGCPDNCDGCTTTNQCFYCRTGFYLFKGACYANCPSGSVANNATFQCTTCNSPCRTCVNQPSICTSCEPGQGFLQITASSQLCVQECAAGTYPNGNVCSVCDFRCAQCLGTSTNCIACPARQFLYQAACWSYCPGVTVNGTCVDACPSNYYRFSNQECRLCSAECETCNNGTSCLTCKNGTSLDGKCVTDCGVGFYAFMGYCVACDRSCRDCQVIPTQCTSCAAGYIKSGINCVTGCSAGQYLDAPSQQCLSCDSSCATCSAQKFCTSCPNPSIQPTQGQCLQCIFPCATCSSYSVCTSCLSGYSLSSSSCVQVCPSGSRAVNGVCSCASGIFLNGQCVSSCPSGFTNINGTCQACQSPCTSCSGSISSCTDCLDGFTLNPNTRICTSSSQCQYGQILSNGNCVRICDDSSSYQNGVCIFGGCSNGFKDNGFGGCVSTNTVTTRCAISTFNLNGVCVSSCGNGFYPNSNNGNCIACQSNCNSCLSGSYCLSCATGFNAIDGSCVAQSRCAATQFSLGSSCVSSCPIGTFTANGICVRSCQPGTYFFSRFCYGSCPVEAPNLTDNACVSTCPSGTTLISGVCASN